MQERHRHYMSRALELAAAGEGFADPNPLVGAVIVKDDRVLAEGYHAAYGSEHAEQAALNAAEEPLEGATMYVNLEPCAHHGKTPPCAEAIVRAGIAKVVIGSIDPNPLVRGKGLDILRSAGVEVVTGILAEKNERLNRFFFHRHREGRPYVILKAAMSADGKIATRTRESQWITNTHSRRDVHRLRHRVQAIAVGAGTVEQDNPRLTARLEGTPTRNPLRIVLDTFADTDPDALVYDSNLAESVLATTENAPEKKLERFQEKGINVWRLPLFQGEISLAALVEKLAGLEVNSLLIEGGGCVNDSAFREGVVDAVHLYLAPKIVGGEAAPTPVGGRGIARIDEARPLRLREIKRFEDDVLLIYDVEKAEVVACSPES